MKRNTARNVSLGLLALMLTVLSCNKAENSTVTPGANDIEPDQTPITVPVETPETAAAAAARVASPVPGYRVTYPYGIRNPDYAAGYHTGDDYAAPAGKPVVAVLGGTIAWSNNNGGAYGRWIGLRATNGRDYVYCHLSVRSVSTGATVVAGQKIGEVGRTGNATGPHLHFEDRPRGGGYGQVRKPTW
ncbi:M23 family metallopeptidase [Niastella caeni]|uniref:M23 family metallopeptidase n=1 Tax=Niastella caeni TaxID=2569763 RepID=A0A4S8HBC9_9BACT|nr:M23 family metallopeptidase [Niastella caeni]THU32067.1 M23 family metallopeptidase [Niastella caeni]